MVPYYETNQRQQHQLTSSFCAQQTLIGLLLRKSTVYENYRQRKMTNASLISYFLKSTIFAKIVIVIPFPKLLMFTK